MGRAGTASRAALLGLGLVTASVRAGQCDDPAETNRDTIIQGVRDDVRRQVRQRETVLQKNAAPRMKTHAKRKRRGPER